MGTEIKGDCRRAADPAAMDKLDVRVPAEKGVNGDANYPLVYDQSQFFPSLDVSTVSLLIPTRKT